MTDVLTAAQRSYNMSQIRSGDTSPELYLRGLLKSSILSNFEVRPNDIFGRPDFYFPEQRSAIFVDGCFWHGCKDCYKSPKTNKKFWNLKISANIKRDYKVNKKLKALGITVVRVKEHELEKKPEVVLNIIKKNISDNRRPKIVDLFAGAGGLSEGFIRAGCEIIGHVEMDKKACSTIITRMTYHALVKIGRIDEYKRYIYGKITRDKLIEKYNLQKEKDSVICARIGEDNIKHIIDQIRSKLNGDSVDFIVGGPPCQAYSYIGRAVDDKNMRLDKRNFLYKYYVDFLKILKPKMFVFENVPGLKSAGKGKYLKNMRHLMKRAGYTTDYKILNASDFGIPQNRKRLILVGWNNKSKLNSYPKFPQVKRNYEVNDFFADLPKIHAGQGKSIKKTSKTNLLLESLGIKDRKFGLLLDHISRPNTKQDLEIYKLAVLGKRKGENIKYNSLPKRLKTHRNENGFLDRFKVVDGKAFGSHTILAHIAKDGHFYIHPDLKQNRSLTVREAARLQTFPDDYKFEGERGPQFRQIGNAVPPMLAEIIATELIKYL